MAESPARRAALEALTEADTRRVFAENVLHAAFKRRPMSREDRALATRLVQETLRRRGALDYRLDRLVTKGMRSLPPLVANALRLGALGYSAWAVQSPQQLDHSLLERLKDREVILCLDLERMDSEVVLVYQELLGAHCARLGWQTLTQAETEWVVVQSREERAQPIEGRLLFQQPEPQLLSRVARAFRRRRGDLRQLFSL